MSRHRELTQLALRNQATLVTLQNQLKQFELEQANSNTPWELISTPTLLDKPVSPSRRRSLALGIVGGLVIGTGAALTGIAVADAFSGAELERELPGPLSSTSSSMGTKGRSKTGMRRFNSWSMAHLPQPVPWHLFQ